MSGRFSELYLTALKKQKERGFLKNIHMDLNGNILTIKIDLTKSFGPSSSGKTIIIASTEGNVAVPGHEDIKVGVNVYTKRST